MVDAGSGVSVLLLVLLELNVLILARGAFAFPVHTYNLATIS